MNNLFLIWISYNCCKRSTSERMLDAEKYQETEKICL